MAITYTWADADETSLKYVDDSTTPDTELHVPVDAGNRHYTAYLAWVAEGNTPSAYVVPVVPASVTLDPTPLELLTARVTAIESNEVSDDAVDASLLTLLADLTTRVTALEG